MLSPRVSAFYFNTTAHCFYTSAHCFYTTAHCFYTSAQPIIYFQLLLSAKTQMSKKLSSAMPLNRRCVFIFRKVSPL